jgi:hypothetical protein
VLALWRYGVALSMLREATYGGMQVQPGAPRRPRRAAWPPAARPPVQRGTSTNGAA